MDRKYFVEVLKLVDEKPLKIVVRSVSLGIRLGRRIKAFGNQLMLNKAI